VAQGVKALADHEAVIQANEALRSLLVDGRITLVPNADHSGVIGTVHFKGLGDHVLEMAGWTRRVGSGKPNEINKKLIGSGGPVRQSDFAILTHSKGARNQAADGGEAGGLGQ
jgi:hypothetical protein